VKEFPATLKYVTVWLVLGTLVFLGYRWYEVQQQLEHISFLKESSGARVLYIKRAGNGHYYLPLDINGQEVMFMIDTGATRSAISRQMARQLGIEEELRHTFNTANGIVQGALGKATLVIPHGLGMRFENFRIAILPNLSGEPLLGMDVLGKLWVTQNAGILKLQAQ
jgi:aspartyl protease family protein